MNSELEGRPARLAGLQERAEVEMRRIGVDMAFIDLLVETFYRRIQAHPRLGPVFEARLAGRWPQHMDKMKRFWSAVALKTGAYGGKPVQAHARMEGLVPDLFPEWLALFAATLADIAPTPQARDWFMATAERIAKSMFLALFHNPAIEAQGSPST